MAAPGTAPGSVGRNDGRGATTKAYLEAINYCKGHGVGHRVEFLFNPNKFTISHSLRWNPGKQVGVGLPEMDFVHGEGRTLSMELFVDTYESGKDARDFIKELEVFTEPDPRNVGEDAKPDPPKIRFGWGQVKLFAAVIKSLNITYTLFHDDGRPARATVSLSLQEVKDPLGPQNPTSGGEPGRRSHLVLPGETLDLIAYHELGDARHWRHLAEINDLTNPLAIRPGQRLIVTPPR